MVAPGESTKIITKYVKKKKKNLKYVKIVQHSQSGLKFTKNIGSEFAEISITTV